MKITPWNCLAVAFSNATKIKLETLIKEIGHDGGEILWPELREPSSRCGHHTQEMVDVCFKFNLAAIMIEAAPARASKKTFDEFNVKFKVSQDKRMKRYLENNSGVLVGELESETRHAVHWDHKHQEVNDPLGKVKNIHDLQIGCFFIVRPFAI